MKKLLFMLLMITFFLSTANAQTVRVFPNGRGEVTVTATEKIAVFSRGTAKVYRKIGFPNLPGYWSLLQTVTNREYLSDAFSSNTSVRVEADAEGAWYSTDATPDIQWSGPTVMMKSQDAPTADTTADTLTVQELMAGIVTGDNGSGGNMALTLPLGTSMDASSDAGSFAINDSFDWVLINLSTDATTDTITLTANTGHTIVGSAIVSPNKAPADGVLPSSSAVFRTRKTAANTFVTYRVN